MRRIFKRRMWIRVLAVTLALALNLGALDGIINGVLQGAFNLGVTDSLVRVNNVPSAYADPGDGSFQPGVFDPNHDKTSTLNFRFDYNHHVRIDLLLDGEVIETLDENAFYRGDYTSPESKAAGQESRNIINHFTWNGKDDIGEPMDDGSYTVRMTPLDEWSEYPLNASVTVRNIPHTPKITGITINQQNGTVTIRGTSQARHTIHMYDNGNYFFTTTADSNGDWWVYNKFLSKETRHTVQAQAENKFKGWPTKSPLSAGIVFLTYHIKAGDTLSQ
ncbi:MAG: hypothetical protein CVV03_03980 [Firmicutes bacterium HGW-Firmicutes-8]|nr:MAG: hypothetical protein CVV03_03980 [Firmicutes bacterium HGW-Firmicutes-8]